MTDELEFNPADASIQELFPAEKIEARFVLAMSMARNDLDRSVRDGLIAAEQDAQDFTYRVRLVTSHLVEALDSLNAYCQNAEVKKLVNRVPKEYKKHLAKARSVVQKVGDKALDTVRNNTFHYPSPKTSYSPSSDEQLRDVLKEMGAGKAYMHLDHRGERPVVTLTFAQEAALALSIAKHSADDDTARAQYTTTSEGAIAFTKWAEALLLTYFDATGAEVGRPEIIDVKKPEA
jgi:hypothetical protein